MTAKSRRHLYIASKAPARNPVPPGAWPTPYASWLIRVVQTGAMDRASGLLLRDVVRPDGTLERRQAVRVKGGGVRVLDWRLASERGRLADWRDVL